MYGNKQLRGRQSKQVQNLNSPEVTIDLNRNMQVVNSLKGNTRKSSKCNSRRYVSKYSDESRAIDNCFARNDVAVTTKNTAVVIPDVLANDVRTEGSTLVLQSHTNPENGILVEDENGVFTYTPETDFVGIDTYEYTVLDGLGGLQVGLVTITVDDIFNRPPNAMNKSVKILQGTEIKMGVNTFASDPDGDSIQIDSCTQPSFGSVQVTNNEVTYIPQGAFTGQESIVCTISDVNGDVGASTLTFEVIDFEPTMDILVARENTPFTQTDPGTGILINDKGYETGQLVLESCTDPELGSFDIDQDGHFSYSPDPFVTGLDKMVCTISNGNGIEKTSDLWITIQPPKFGQGLTTQEDVPLTVLPSDIISASSPLSDSDSVPAGSTINACNNPVFGAMGLNGDGSFTYVPLSNFNGLDAFECDITTPDDVSDKIVTSVTVTAVGDEPIAFSDTIRVDQNSAVSFDPVANDIDLDEDTLRLVDFTKPVHGTVTLNSDGTLRYVPKPNFLGTDESLYTITDGVSGVSSAKIMYIVNTASVNANTPPSANDDNYKTNLNTPLSVNSLNGVLSNDSDDDGNNLIISSFTQPLIGELSLSQDGSFIYTPKLNWEGVDVFSYILNDGFETDIGNVSIVVSKGTQGPAKANPDSFSGPENKPLSVKSPGVLENDENIARFLGFTQPQHGTLSAGKSGDFIYFPKDDFVGTDTFTYTIVDDNGNISTATVSLNMKIVDLPPLIVIGADELVDLTGSNSNTQRVSSDCTGDNFADCAGQFGQ